MITSVLIDLFEKELNLLSEEIKGYEQDDQLWKVAGGILNSGGNLCLHITGSLQHFIGATLGDAGYIRNRDAEFRLKNIPRQKLLEEIEITKSSVTDALEQVSKKELETNYPIPLFEQPISTEHFLLFLLRHTAYHVGQINYHRRLIG